MRKPPRTFLLVEAVLDENDVPYLVADPSAPSRRVGVKRKAQPPKDPDHFAEHFELHAHVVDCGTDPRNLAHYLDAAAAKTLKIHGRCQAMSLEEAVAKLQPPAPFAPSPPPAAAPVAPASAAPPAPAPAAP